MHLDMYPSYQSDQHVDAYTALTRCCMANVTFESVIDGSAGIQIVDREQMRTSIWGLLWGREWSKLEVADAKYHVFVNDRPLLRSTKLLMPTTLSDMAEVLPNSEISELNTQHQTRLYICCAAIRRDFISLGLH